MKVMYICGMYCPSHGGAEISMYSLLRCFKEDIDWDVAAVTDSRYESTKTNDLFNKVRIEAVNHNMRLGEIEQLILGFNPDVILTQLMWSDIALKLAKKYKIPSIMRVCKIPMNLDLSIGSECSPTAIIATSNIVKNYVKKNWNREVTIIMPLVETKDYIISNEEFSPADNEYIVMFNPLVRKGGEIFKEIAKRLPNKKFGTVLGWSSLKENPLSNKFSSEYIQRINESEGSSYDGSLPSYIDFSNCSNVEIFKPEDDARVIYKKTKILLVPSQWEEAFGRVAIEGMVNGIPVIGSDVGGLKESIGNGGILLDKSDIKEWIKEILKFDNRDYYNQMSKKAKDWVRKNYSESKILEASVNLIEETVNFTKIKSRNSPPYSR